VEDADPVVAGWSRWSRVARAGVLRGDDIELVVRAVPQVVGVGVVAGVDDPRRVGPRLGQRIELEDIEVRSAATGPGREEQPTPPGTVVEPQLGLLG
jgi:hypothetical protein